MKSNEVTEEHLQIAFINWMRGAFNGQNVTAFHVRNENAVNAIQGKRFKDQGVLAGVHDNIIIWPHRNFGTIELKSPSKPKSANKYSDKQQAFAESMERAGWTERHACCQTGEEIEAVIRSWGLKPQWKFPPLERSGRNILMQNVAFEMYGGWKKDS